MPLTEMKDTCKEVGMSLLGKKQQEFHCTHGDFEMSICHTHGEGN